MRDPRIDFFRGLALLVLCIDHNEELSGVQALSYITYAPVGIATGAEAFVFLSGLTLGYAYQPVFAAKGYWMVHARCVVRAWQLYLLHIVGLVLTIAVITLVPGLLNTDAAALTVSESIRPSSGMLARFATLRANPVYFDILPLYIILLLSVPPLFPALRRSVGLGLSLSAVIYVLGQTIAAALGPRALPFAGSMFYNPIAWQFLFVIGLTVAVHLRMGGQLPSLSRRGLVGLLVALAALGLWYKLARVNALIEPFGPVDYAPGSRVPYDVPFIDKALLGPVRVLHFVVLAFVIATLCPKDAVWLRSRLAAPVIACGSQALEVFVFGTVFTYAVATIMEAAHGGRVLIVGLDLVAVAASCGVAYLVRWRKSEPWRRTT
jgi:hypothetical protein